MDGETPQQIASRTHRSPETIRSLFSSAFHRLGVPNATQAVLSCLRAGWIDVDGNEKAAAIKPRLINRPLTPAQQVAMYAFDMYAATRDQDEKRALKRIIARAYQDAGIGLHRDRKDRNSAISYVS